MARARQPRAIPEAQLRFSICNTQRDGARRYLASINVPYEWTAAEDKAHVWLHRREADAFFAKQRVWKGQTPAGTFAVCEIARRPN